MADVRSHFLICTGGGCIASGALDVSKAVREEIEARGLAGEIDVVETGCLGPCVQGPVALVYPDGVFYQNIKVDDVPELVEEHLLKGRVVERLVSHAPGTDRTQAEMDDIPFFNRQVKIVLRNSGIIDPLKIDEYIAREGYQALAKVLTEMTPEQVVQEILDSGLRGRGGAGFPTGMKWRFAQQQDNDVKYILCNADEGDPGAFMDRSVLEGDPHSLIEGMTIGAFAIGAHQGYVYVRAEYPLAVERLEHALGQARDYGLLGKDIMGSGFDFDLEIRMGSGAFVCGEETALMTSIEGNRGEPRPRPPFPAVSGLWGKPSVLNNVETFANIAPIILKGAAWFASTGTESSAGTKVFALGGNVQHTGLVEVPIGMQLGELVYEVGGGIPNGKSFKAAQLGGPSGGCIPKEHLNVPVDYATLQELGAIMGSGGVIVMDEDTCMVDIARFFLEFTQEESCGKCPPCRVGTKRMLEIVERICNGEGEEGDIERLIALGETISETALCGLGQTAPNPVLSTIRHFRHEYEAHIKDKYCEAGVCATMFKSPCSNACPASVNIPGFVSLVGEQRYDEALKMHRERNPLASICARVCFHPCESKCMRSSLDGALAIRHVKRFMVEQEKEPQLPEIRESAENAARKVAVIGSGPAGLSAAYFLCRLGYKPVVFEAEPKAGGMLVQAIPAYRLPRQELEREVKMIESMGAAFEYGKALGRDFTLQDLRDEGYEAVFVAVGAPQGTGIGVPGEDGPGVYDGLSFLKEYNIHEKGEVGKNVAVIGGGNAAIDAARTALRLGAESVKILYRRTRAQMPAWGEEVNAADLEGIDILTLVAPEEILRDADGNVTGVRCREMVLGDYDRSGRRRPVAGRNPDFVVEADTVIAAIGQKLDAPAILDGTPVELNRWGYLAADPNTGQTSVDWVFTGGDAATGPSSVVEAIGAGEKAAAAIDQFLTGANHAFWRRDIEPPTFFDPDADPKPVDRHQVEELAVGARVTNFDEVELSWAAEVALAEARRCLRCDYGKYCS
ncbi:MAG TPA: NADH-quinone oxidoreductase subunit NuoF [Thermoleophilia bacterium]|nr:NADH-quinone oxidoreductase subunit NuoF [Acidobacteriota bacterium]HQF52968.1 NADH-quinone oxidoreductase subunit NuoF [Thermoleophilia bacterium]HQH21874.1 NADH-quinone oxidoreductase subunit NuoF [Thermoleophilia bacterium]